jgi:hypothetical protein
VLDIATGQPLLPSPLPGCGEVLLWWGSSSNTLAYSHHGGSSSSSTQLCLLKVQPLQQQQEQQQQVALLYVPVDGERGLELDVSADREFVVLSSSVEVSRLPRRRLGGGGDYGNVCFLLCAACMLAVIKLEGNPKDTAGHCCCLAAG